MVKPIIVKQRILNPSWAFLVALLAVATPICFIWFSGDAFRKEDSYLLFAHIPVGVILFFFLQHPNHFELGKKGIHYKSFPLSRKFSFVSKDDVTNWEIADYKSFKLYNGLGYRRSFGKNYSYVQRFGKVLKVKTRDGRKITFGIDDGFKTKSFIQQNWK